MRRILSRRPRLVTALTGHSRGHASRPNGHHRRLNFEALEDRRLLAIAFDQIWTDLDNFRFIVGDHEATADRMESFFVTCNATFSSAPGLNSPSNVEFEIDDQIAIATRTGDIWSARIDMSEVADETSRLKVKAYEDVGAQPQQNEHSLQLISIPDWMTAEDIEYIAEADPTDGYTIHVLKADVQKDTKTPDNWWILSDKHSGFKMGPTFTIKSNPAGSVNVEGAGYLIQAKLLDFSVFQTVIPAGVKDIEWELKNLNNLADGKLPQASFVGAEWQDFLTIETLDLPEGKTKGTSKGWYIGTGFQANIALDTNLEFQNASLELSAEIGYRAGAAGKLVLASPAARIPLLGAFGVPPNVVDLLFIASVRLDGKIQFAATANVGSKALNVTSLWIQPTLSLEVRGSAQAQFLGSLTPLGGAVAGVVEQSLIAAYWTPQATIPIWFTEKTTNDLVNGWNFFAPGRLDLTVSVFSEVKILKWTLRNTWWRHTWTIARWDFLHGTQPNDTGAKGTFDYDAGPYFVSDLERTYTARLNGQKDEYGFYLPKEVELPATIALSDPDAVGLSLTLLTPDGLVKAQGDAGTPLLLSELSPGAYYLHVTAPAGATNPQYSLEFDIRYDRHAASTVYVVDRSIDMSADDFDEARGAATVLVNEMQPGDRVGVVSYAGTASVAYPLTLVDESVTQTSEANAAIDSLTTDNGAYLGSAIELAVEQLELFPDDPARSIVIVTDGKNEQLEETRRIMKEMVPSDIRVFAINVGDQAEMEYLEDLTQLRKGLASMADSGHELLDVYIDIITRRSALSGFVYADTNRNEIPDQFEGVPGVLITLSGTTYDDQVITRQTWTDTHGWYEFPELLGGRYTVGERQPLSMIDGGENTISNALVQAAVSTVAQDYRELGLKPEYVFNRLYSTQSMAVGSTAWNETCNDVVEQGELDGDHVPSSPPEAVSSISAVAATVLVTGTNGDDQFTFKAADSTSGQHEISLNGVTRYFDAALVESIHFDGGLGIDTATLTGSSATDRYIAEAKSASLLGTTYAVGITSTEMTISNGGAGTDDDEVTFMDSISDDTLHASLNSASLSAYYYEHELHEYERITARSERGGKDRKIVDVALTDYLLETDGLWSTL